MCEVGRHQRVRLYRSEESLGIIRVTWFCLDRPLGRDATPVDHDDLLAPDTVRMLTHSLVRGGYSTLAYTDEDKVEGQCLSANRISSPTESLWSSQRRVIRAS